MKILENINCNLQYNNGQNYLETVKETLNEVSNSRIDILEYIIDIL